MYLKSKRAAVWFGTGLILSGGLIVGYKPFRIPILAYLGNAKAMEELGNAYASVSGKGLLVRHDGRKAHYWWEQAAERGNTGAIYSLYQSNFVVTKDWSVVKKWLPKGAELGDPECATELSKAYEFGLYGFEVDMKKSNYWNEKAREFIKKSRKSGH